MVFADRWYVDGVHLVMRAIRILVVAAILAACVLLARVEQASSARPVVASTTFTNASPEQPAIQSTTRFTVGVERRYRVAATYEVAIEHDGKRQIIEIAVAGHWILGVARVQADAVVLRGELAAHEIRIGGKANAALVQALAKPHFLTVRPSGRFVSLHFDGSTEKLARGIVRSLVASSQLVVDGGTTWETIERDQTGEYTARYTRDGDAIEKMKVRYLSIGAHDVGAQTAMVSAPEVRELVAASRADIDAATWPTKLTVEERIVIALQQGARTTATTHVELVLEDVATRPIAADLTGLDEVGIASTQSPHDADRVMVGGATLPDLLGQLRVANSETRLDVYAKLESLFRLHPELAAEIPAKLRADARDSDILLGALAAAGTPQAQAALVAVIEDGARGLRADAAAATIQVAQPSQQLTTTLARGLDGRDPELRTASALGLGAAAMRIGATDTDRGDAIVDGLLARLAATRDVELQLVIVKALGNSGSTRAVEALRGLLASTEPMLRRGAVMAMRAIADGAVDPLIAHTLVSDPDPRVRAGALFAAEFRSADAMHRALVHASTKDTDDNVRAEATRLLARR